MNESNNKFDGFQEDDDIIINPEFGRSLKESLKQSKRRLMLFIDNNEELNPIEERSRFSRIIIKDSETSKASNANKKKPKLKKKQIKTDNKRFSLGLQNEEVEYSEAGDEDLCLCEVEPIPGFLGYKKQKFSS